MLILIRLFANAKHVLAFQSGYKSSPSSLAPSLHAEYARSSRRLLFPGSILHPPCLICSRRDDDENRRAARHSFRMQNAERTQYIFRPIARPKALKYISMLLELREKHQNGIREFAANYFANEDNFNIRLNDQFSLKKLRMPTFNFTIVCH